MAESVAQPTVIPDDRALVPAGLSSPMPVFQGQQMAQALVAYKELQRTLDVAMPDQLMELDGKAFRKKGYWRAVAVAFNIDVELVEERREVDGAFEDGRENFGYIVTYRAKASNGRSEPGDGACFAIEKARRFKCPHPHPQWKGKTEHWPHETCPDFDPDFEWRRRPAQATIHNVRSHAHTRAFNRAVSNLCGFGEVSAEEIDRDEERESQTPRDFGPRFEPPSDTMPPLFDENWHSLEVAAADGKDEYQRVWGGMKGAFKTYARQHRKDKLAALEVRAADVSAQAKGKA